MSPSFSRSAKREMGKRKKCHRDQDRPKPVRNLLDLGESYGETSGELEMMRDLKRDSTYGRLLIEESRDEDLKGTSVGVQNL